MQETRAVTSSKTVRIQALQARRAKLKDQIKEERKHPATGSEMVSNLKRENLKLKDEIHQESEST